MSSATAPLQTLRLVRAPEAPPVVDRVYDIRAARVLSENRSAALAAQDPRWVLAVRTASALEGGRAAILPPIRRERLMVLASRLGLRPFDASLVIAIVQDAARAGEPLQATEPRLAMLRPPEAPRTVSPWVLLGVSAVLGAAACAAMIAWFQHG